MIRSARLAILAAAMATGHTVAAQTPTVNPGSADHGTIVLYRAPSVVGMAVACPIRFKGQVLVELGRGKYAEWPVPAGSYVLNNKVSSVEVAVVPGQTRYVRCVIKMGIMAGRADLQIVDKESYAEHQGSLVRKEIAMPGDAAGASGAK